MQAQPPKSEDSDMSAGESRIALTPQQRHFSSEQGRLSKYRELVVGNAGVSSLVFFELYQLLIAPLPGLLGLGLRSVTLPRYLGGCGRGSAVGRNVTFRQPLHIKLGSHVIIDDEAVLDVRSSPNFDGNAGITLGDCVTVGRQSLIIAKNANISIGPGSNISSFCRIASESKITIGSSVLIAAYAYIGPGNHNFDDPLAPIMEQGMNLKGGVSIGDNAWIGSRATILDGVTIGTGAIIAAHSLVKDNVPDGAIVAGTPAKVIRYRK